MNIVLESGWTAISPIIPEDLHGVAAELWEERGGEMLHQMETLEGEFALRTAARKAEALYYILLALTSSPVGVRWAARYGKRKLTEAEKDFFKEERRDKEDRDPEPV